MFFRKVCFLILVLFILPHCGLKVGEEAVFFRVHKINQSQSINYADELRSYISDEDLKKSNERVEYVSFQVSDILNSYKNRVKGQEEKRLVKKEIISLLNKDYIKKNMEGFVDFITSEKYFPIVNQIKSQLLPVLNSYQEGRPVDFKGQCPVAEEGSLYREEVDNLNLSVKDVSEVLQSINEDAEVLFHYIFSVYKNPPKEKTTLQSFFSLNMLRNKNIFTPSLYSQDNSESISLFNNEPFFHSVLRDTIEKKKWDTPSGFFEKIPKSKRSKLIKSFISMFRYYMPEDYDSELGPSFSKAHLKYMLLNIYLVEMFFHFYDKNRNNLLDKEELTNLFCLFNPILNMVATIFEGDIDSKYLDEKLLFYYVIRTGRIPDGGIFNNLHYIAHLSLMKGFWSDSYTDVSLDYVDMSQVLSVLATLLPYKFLNPNKPLYKGLESKLWKKEIDKPINQFPWTIR